jgi:hypothetical protein
MKTTIVGWIYFIITVLLSTYFAFATIAILWTLLLMHRVGYVDATYFQYNINTLGRMFLGLGLSIFGVYWSMALKRHKQWSWYVGIGLASLNIIGDAFYIFHPSILMVANLLFSIFVLYALISERPLFLSDNSK